MTCEFENLNRVYKVHSDLLDFFLFLSSIFFPISSSNALFICFLYDLSMFLK